MGSQATAPPPRNPAIFAQRFPARLHKYNQSSRTGATGAVNSDDPAAAPAIKPAAARPRCARAFHRHYRQPVRGDNQEQAQPVGLADGAEQNYLRIHAHRGHGGQCAGHRQPGTGKRERTKSAVRKAAAATQTAARTCTARQVSPNRRIQPAVK